MRNATSFAALPKISLDELCQKLETHASSGKRVLLLLRDQNGKPAISMFAIQGNLEVDQYRGARIEQADNIHPLLLLDPRNQAVFSRSVEKVLADYARQIGIPASSLQLPTVVGPSPEHPGLLTVGKQQYFCNLRVLFPAALSNSISNLSRKEF